MNTIGIIPARFGATRFEGKVLALLDNKPVIQHVYERAKKAKSLDDLIVACDDERIKKAVKSFGGKVILTAKGHITGTDRLTEVVNPLDVKYVVNIQGDEPFIHPSMIDDAVYELQRDEDASVSTVIKKITEKEDIDNPDIVKAVVDKHGYALYFSRAPIPYARGSAKSKFYKHIGLYVYTKDFLFTFKTLAHSMLEETEKLEQLRILENGYKIKTVETKYDTLGIDTPEDLEKARGRLRGP